MPQMYQSRFLVRSLLTIGVFSFTSFLVFEGFRTGYFLYFGVLASSVVAMWLSSILNRAAAVRVRSQTLKSRRNAQLFHFVSLGLQLYCLLVLVLAIILAIGGQFDQNRIQDVFLAICLSVVTLFVAIEAFRSRREFRICQRAFEYSMEPRSPEFHAYFSLWTNQSCLDVAMAFEKHGWAMTKGTDDQFEIQWDEQTKLKLSDESPIELSGQIRDLDGSTEQIKEILNDLKIVHTFEASDDNYDQVIRYTEVELIYDKIVNSKNNQGAGEIQD